MRNCSKSLLCPNLNAIQSCCLAQSCQNLGSHKILAQSARGKVSQLNTPAPTPVGWSSFLPFMLQVNEAFEMLRQQTTTPASSTSSVNASQRLPKVWPPVVVCTQKKPRPTDIKAPKCSLWSGGNLAKCDLLHRVSRGFVARKQAKRGRGHRVGEQEHRERKGREEIATVAQVK